MSERCFSKWMDEQLAKYRALKKTHLANGKYINQLQAENKRLREALEYFVDCHGYIMFISDDEKESEQEVITARHLISKGDKS